MNNMQVMSLSSILILGGYILDSITVCDLLFSTCHINNNLQLILRSCHKGVKGTLKTTQIKEKGFPE